MILRTGLLWSYLILILLPVKAQEITVTSTSLRHSECSEQFVTHTLDHITTVDHLPVRLFDSNGSGLAINDLNKDGLLDIVLANLDAPETILWNQGDLQFRPQVLDIPGKTRSVATLDLNSDGWKDIIFTSQRAAPSFWLNQQDETFAFSPLRGVTKPAYAMNWYDLDRDGDLDLVAASYDAEMERIDASYLLNGGAGIFYYANNDNVFHPTRLADRSQALAVDFPDINLDGYPDIAVGNDFAERDRYWKMLNGEWAESQPFEVTTYSTMSFASGDVNNDGHDELLATDMHPYLETDEVQAAWEPIMQQMMEVPMPEGDPQHMVNVLQSAFDGQYQNIAENHGIHFTGWSWSGKFGDLNSDGLLDIYVVNGMISEELFGHLPDNELVEENQAFMNTGQQMFVPMPGWKLNSTHSGRGMSMADMDGDGDLDIVVNNLMAAATLFENQLCGGHNLTVELHQPDTSNPDAIGTRLELVTADGTYYRLVTASSGYLSGDPSPVHFGLPTSTEIQQLIVQWHDGTQSVVEEIQPDTHLSISR